MGSVSFTGFKADNSTVTKSFTTNLNLFDLETVDFSSNNFTNLVRVEWSQDLLLLHQFDNINVSVNSSTAVPEPFTLLGTLIGAGYGVALKRKLAKSPQDRQDD